MTYVPEIPWPRVAGRIQRHWNPIEENPHKAIFAQSRAGKSYLIRRGLLPLVPCARVVVIDVKPGGDPSWDEWGEDVTALAPGFGDNANGEGDAWYRVRLLPGDEGESQVRRILDQIAAEGECIIVMDDARKITDPRAPGLKCGMVVDHLLLEGAALGISVILGANSAAWATSSLRDQCGTILLGHLGGEARDDCAKLAGLSKPARAELDTIAPKRFLYVDAHDGTPMLARTAIIGALGAEVRAYAIGEFLCPGCGGIANVIVQQQPGPGRARPATGDRGAPSVTWCAAWRAWASAELVCQGPPIEDGAEDDEGQGTAIAAALAALPPGATIAEVFAAIIAEGTLNGPHADTSAWDHAGTAIDLIATGYEPIGLN